MFSCLRVMQHVSLCCWCSRATVLMAARKVLQLCLTAAASTISQYVGVESLLVCGGRGAFSIVEAGIVSC